VHVHTLGEVDNFYAALLRIISVMLCTKLYGNLLTTFKVKVKNPLAYLFVDTVYN